jgi:hypothetical protein
MTRGGAWGAQMMGTTELGTSHGLPRPATSSFPHAPRYRKMLRLAGSKVALARPLFVRSMGTPTYTGSSFKEGERAVEARATWGAAEAPCACVRARALRGGVVAGSAPVAHTQACTLRWLYTLARKPNAR